MADPWCVICTLGVLLAPAPVTGFDADSSRSTVERESAPPGTPAVAHGVVIKYSSRLDLMRELATAEPATRRRPRTEPPAHPR